MITEDVLYYCTLILRALVLVCPQPILESGVIELLCSLTRSDSPALRVNGIWALMVRRKHDRHVEPCQEFQELNEAFFLLSCF